ncbi:hypothetical protein Pst134EA_032333 [Puccinia striiformis f. sp. tritici]|uniref:uncharacterized protein n=1 Tax=Puccinia striiformis f. sp. tritici TaxID=168172 RepID=UPI00200755FA|nr:uncharacterized protein Pst134EA_032333 [Puccinia striiformis f. sp. tritici]KAH9444318.1 hypothetical protein Pst134EA_032333 [Puccinia striiformis f. sp. tritici]
MKKNNDSAKGYVEVPDPYRTKTRDGRTILCFACGLGGSAVKRLRIIGCDACDANFHLDCLDPPLVTLPSCSSKWVCPLHMDKTLPCRQAPKEASVIPIDTLNTPNNGDINVLVTPQNRTKAKQVEEIIINRVKYHVPENIIILDFWAKLGKGHELLNTALLDPPPARDNLLAALTNQASTSATPSLKNSSLAPTTNASREDVVPRPSSTDSVTHSSSLLPRPSSSTIVPTTHPDLSCLLQAAQQINEVPAPQTTEGLALLGNAASLQTPVTSNPRRSHKKKTNVAAPRTRTRGSARLSKSASTPSEVPDIQTPHEQNIPPEQSEPSSKALPDTPSTVTGHIDMPLSSNDTSASSNKLLLPLPIPPAPSTRTRKRKKRVAAPASSLTAPIDQTQIATTPSTVQADTSDIAHCPQLVNSATVANAVPSQTLNITQSAQPHLSKPHSSISNYVVRHDDATRDPLLFSSIPAVNSAPSNTPHADQSAPLDNSRPELPISRKATTSDQHSHVDRPLGCTFAHVLGSYPAHSSPSEGRPTPAQATETLPFASHNPATSNSKQKTALGQFTQSTLAPENPSVTSVSHISPDLQGIDAERSETSSVARPLRKKARRSTNNSHAQSTNSTPLSKAAELQTVLPSLPAVSQPLQGTLNVSQSSSRALISSTGEVTVNRAEFSSATNTSQSSSRAGDALSGTAMVNRVDVPGRTTINRGQKSTKAPSNKMATPSLTSMTPGPNAAESTIATAVPPNHRDPAIHQLHCMSSSASSMTPSSATIGLQQTTKNTLSGTVPASVKHPEQTKSTQNHMTPDLLSQSVQPPATSSNTARHSLPTGVAPTTKTKRKKSVKNSSIPPSSAYKQTADKAQSHVSEKFALIASQDNAFGTTTFTLDPRLAAPANTEVLQAYKPSGLGEGPANSSAKISISLARYENDQSKTLASAASTKPPRKKVKRKSAPANGSTHPTVGAASLPRAPPPNENPISPYAPQLSQSTLRPAAPTFVPHPQNPMTHVPQHLRGSPHVAHPHSFPFVHHPQHSPTAFNTAAAQQPYVPHPQHQAPGPKSAAPSILNGRTLTHEGSGSQGQSRRGSLTVHGSSPPLATTSASPVAPLIDETKFATAVGSRPSSAVGNPASNQSLDGVFIPLPLTKPVKATPDPSSWK